MNKHDAVTEGLKLIEDALGKKCHLDKPLKARMKYLKDHPQTTMTALIVEMLMCASKYKAYDVPSPTMDIARCSYESFLDGIILF